MRRGLRTMLALGVVLAAASGTARAQWYYPRGYGGWGWSQWGSDPGAGYMAGLGSYARSYGAYEVQDAKATSMNIDNVLRWNQALAKQRKAYQAEKRKADARAAAEAGERVRQADIENGNTLNFLLAQLLEVHPSALRGAASKSALSPMVMRDIPFESASEAITICLDQMTADDGWPATLQDGRFADDRQAIRRAVRKALAEDARGDVSPQTIKQINAAVKQLRAKYTKTDGEFELIYNDADEFVKSLAGLSAMLTNPALKPVLAQLETYKGGSLADLIQFMATFNLRFGPATSDRQKDIYHQLVPAFQQVYAEATGQAPNQNAVAIPNPPAPALDETGKPLQSAARGVFRGMSWGQINAAHEQPQK